MVHSHLNIIISRYWYPNLIAKQWALNGENYFTYFVRSWKPTSHFCSFRRGVLPRGGQRIQIENINDFPAAAQQMARPKEAMNRIEQSKEEWPTHWKLGTYNVNRLASGSAKRASLHGAELAAGHLPGQPGHCDCDSARPAGHSGHRVTTVPGPVVL